METNNILPNNQQVKDEYKREIKKKIFQQMNTETQHTKTYKRMRKKFLEENIEPQMHILRK